MVRRLRLVPLVTLCVGYLVNFFPISTLAQDANSTDALPASWPQVSDVAAQPLVASIKRLSTALSLAGSPLDKATEERLNQAYVAGDADSIKLVQQVLDPLCIAAVSINPESRVKVVGPSVRSRVDATWLAAHF